MVTKNEQHNAPPKVTQQKGKKKNETQEAEIDIQSQNEVSFVQGEDIFLLPIGKEKGFKVNLENVSSLVDQLVNQFPLLADPKISLQTLRQQIPGVLEYLNGVVSGDGIHSFIHQIKNFPIAFSPYKKPIAITNQDWPFKNSLAGLYAVLGGAGAGKSEVIGKGFNVDIMIRHGETAEVWDYEEFAGPNAAKAFRVERIEDVLVCSLVLSSLGFHVAIDSFRDLIFNLNGASLGTGGVNNALFAFLTAFSNLCHYYDVCVIAAVNPMVSDASMDVVVKNISASITGAVTVKSAKVDQGTYRSAKGRTMVDPLSINRQIDDNPINKEVKNIPVMGY